MATRLLIVADQATRAARDQLTIALRELSEVAWWHRFTHLWLIVDPKNRGTLWWRDWCGQVAPRLRILVMKPTLGEWGGRLRKEQAQWLHGPWKNFPAEKP
jgi:hypothetical protein